MKRRRSTAPKVGMRPARVLVRDAAFEVEAGAKLGDRHSLEAVDLRTSEGQQCVRQEGCKVAHIQLACRERDVSKAT